MSEMIGREILIREADGTNVPRPVIIVKTASFKPYRSELLPYEERFEKDDYCEFGFNLTDACYLSHENAQIFKSFPRNTRTPIIDSKFIHFELSLTNDNSKSTDPANPPKPLPLVPYSDSDDTDTDTDENNHTFMIPDVDSDQEDSEKTRKRKRRSGGIGKRNKSVKKKVMDGPDPPPPMPENMREKIESGEGSWQGHGLVLVLQKKLYKSDLVSQQNRLSIPMRQLESLDFLRKEERVAAKARDEDNKHILGIKGVRLMDPKLAEYRVDFKRWKLKNSSSYMITNKWSAVVKQNQFKPGDIVQVWFFRDRQDNPCFALAKLS